MDWLIILGQTDAGFAEWSGPIVNLVTAGGFGALVWYLIVKHIPAKDDRHMLERQEDAKELEARAVGVFGVQQGPRRAIRNCGA